MKSLFRLAALTLCAVLGMNFANAQSTVDVKTKRNATIGTVDVKIKRNATIWTDDAHLLFVHVKVKCDTTADVLEAFVTVDQAGAPGAFGEGFLELVECDGRQHGHLVKVESFDGLFHTGNAQASAFILICDEQDNCIEGQATRVINIRESRRPAQ